MDTFSALLAICVGNSPASGEFPIQGQWRGALMFSLICVWINNWVNNRVAGDLRRHGAHCDVIVIYCMCLKLCACVSVTKPCPFTANRGSECTECTDHCVKPRPVMCTFDASFNVNRNKPLKFDDHVASLQRTNNKMFSSCVWYKQVTHWYDKYFAKIYSQYEQLAFFMNMENSYWILRYLF